MINVRKTALIVAVVAILLLVAMSVYARSKKKKEYSEFMGKIQRETAGCSDIANLENVMADRHFDAKYYAYVIYDAKKCSLCSDDKDAVIMALSNKTLPEIKAIEDEMKKRYGVTILQHLDGFWSSKELKQKVQTIINNAPK